MRVLVAEDEAVSRRLLQAQLAKWGYEAVLAADGEEAWTVVREHEEIGLCLLDWMMPRLNGPDFCRRVKRRLSDRPFYLLLCTARKATADIVEGLSAGADDYLTKPICAGELQARVRAGARTLALEQTLRMRIRELHDALEHVHTLQGLLPICMHCKSIRTSEDAWQRIEDYIVEHAEVEFSHGLCGRCLAQRYGAMESGG